MRNALTKRTRCCERDGWLEISLEKLHLLPRGKERASGENIPERGTACAKDQGQEEVREASASEAARGTLPWPLCVDGGEEARETRQGPL